MAVIDVVRSIQEASGRSSGGITGSTRPLTDLDGFDSLNCVEASTQLSISLGVEISADVGLFTQDGQPRTIDEIAKDIQAFHSETTE